ncbi:hypothetical protein HID58_023194, partial [Brassica napus]
DTVGRSLRLLRFWKSLNGRLMGVDMLLLDSKLNTFKHLLSEGSLYELSVFEVTRIKPNFCFSFVGFNYDQLMVLANKNTDLQVFDGLAKLLEENLLSRNEEPEVLVATNINPKLVGGNTLPHRLFLNKTSTTHLYLDNECVAGASYLQ